MQARARGPPNALGTVQYLLEGMRLFYKNDRKRMNESGGCEDINMGRVTTVAHMYSDLCVVLRKTARS